MAKVFVMKDGTPRKVLPYAQRRRASVREALSDAVAEVEHQRANEKAATPGEAKQQGRSAPQESTWEQLSARE